MSWVKRRGPNTPSPAPPVSMYTPNQHSMQEVNQWSKPQTHDNWYNQQQYQPLPNQENTPPQDHVHLQQQQNYWQQPYNYNQNYGQPQHYNQYATGNFPDNVAYNNQQAFGNVQYNQHYPQNTLYGQPQDVANQQNEGDAWNQAWGDEENSNVQVATQQSGNNSSRSGNVSEAFVNDESWNWAVEESVSSSASQNNYPKTVDLPKRRQEVDSDLNKPLSSQEHLQLVSKRGKLETPQWSTESQVSQESSDDVLPTSESDKSHMLSRNSTKSHSPTSRQDSALGLHSEDGPGRSDAYEHLSNFENKEILSNARSELQQKANSTPPPPKNVHTPPLMPPISGNVDDSKNPYKRTAGLSHKASKYSLPTISQNDSSQNLYQPSFHNQQVNLETVPDNSEQPDSIPSQQFQKLKPVIPSPENNEVPINDRNQYLETGQLSQSSSQNFSQISDVVPNIDPSDSFPPPGLRRMVPGQLEQNEIGGNLNTFGDLYSQTNDDLQIEGNDTLPPPGLRRMVPGQLEQTDSVRSTVSFNDEPPVGLSRMVLGQTETVSNIQMTSSMQNDNVSSQYETPGPPEGLHRMVPGESSSPESHQRQLHLDENDSEPEFQQLVQQTPQPRSATIGADTPPSVIPPQPVTSRSDRNGGNQTADIGRAKGSLSGGRSEKSIRKGSHNASKESMDQVGRRDSIEGQTQDNEISNITNSVRNLAVGENVTDGHTSNTSLPEIGATRLSRHESSDSDKEHKKPPRVPRDKRSVERTKRDKEREKNRERDIYSPDKKYDRRRYRDRRYEDDTEDFYSDREKDRDVRYDRDPDYERKYSSLRKEKSKDRYRRDPREYRRGEYYYERDRVYDEDYNYENNRSRPSSRSDSMHESFMDRHEKERRDRRQVERDREKDRYRRQRDRRDVYNPYDGFSSYDPYNPYYQQYQYLENLRRTNPQAYSEWYRKYYQHATGQTSSYGGEDRASVHSGRSSANDELAKDRYMKQSFYSNTSLDGLDMTNYSRQFGQADNSHHVEDKTLEARLTPAKFSTAHLKASISSGKLLRVLPCYPIDGQNATVEISSLQSLLMNDDEYKELNVFPGPLIKGTTHKKTIIEYCEHKIKYASYNKEMIDPDSYILMWELLILLIRQNGMVVGTDIAELLLKNSRESYPQRPSSALSSIGSNVEDVNSESRYQNENVNSIQSVLKEEEITSKFREFLLYGSAQEALEWAMKHGLWGHALFLGSKLDKRTYANIMMRFANGLTMNDPLQTLYQLLSGTMPAVVTCVADEKWGDWRPHLAMILSNSTQRPELNCKAITTLGDTLRNRGNLYAAQFCYLMAEVGFGRYEDPETRLVLLGADHNREFSSFAASENIHMTEIYEYACGLNDADFIIPDFQIYKYLLATRLADRGLLEKALAYLEKLSGSIIANTAEYSISFVNHVCDLSDRLKFYDPVGEVEDESQFGAVTETSRPDHSWLRDLRTTQENLQAGLIYQQEPSDLQNYPPNNLEMEPSQQVIDANINEAWQQQYDQQYQQSLIQQQQQQWQPDQTALVDYPLQESQQNDIPQPQFSDQQQWHDQMSQYNQENIDQHQIVYGGNSLIEEPTPQITMPNQSRSQIFEEDAKKDLTPMKTSPAKPKLQTPAQDKTQSTGWFGGIFSRLSLRPKNQMKLPEDKNPKIVWDDAKKKWVNIDEDSHDTSNELKPPPKMSDIKPKPFQQDVMPVVSPTFPAGGSQPTSMSSYGNINRQPESLPISGSVTEEMNPLKSSQANNMFKMQRGRNLKNSYVDVFNPGGKSSGPSSLPAPDTFSSTSAPQMNFFVPPPVSDPNAPVDFLSGSGGW